MRPTLTFSCLPVESTLKKTVLPDLKMPESRSFTGASSMVIVILPPFACDPFAVAKMPKAMGYRSPYKLAGCDQPPPDQPAIDYRHQCTGRNAASDNY